MACTDQRLVLNQLVSGRQVSKMEHKPKLLYQDIYELIDFRGIKENKVANVMQMSYNNWYKTKKKNLSNLSLDEIDQLAMFLDLPPEQVFTLCYTVHKRALINAQNALAEEEAKAEKEAA